MSWKRVIRSDELPVGAMRAREVDLEEILVCRTVEGELHAIENTCSHDEGPLGEGQLQGSVVECPRHGGQFDVATGRAVRMPAFAPIRTFPVRASADGWIEVDVDAD